jgi:hypothetical protein
MRQSAEWGMRAFQSSMPRIKDRMKFEERGERKVTLTVMILLYNLQACMVGINQLQSFYVGALYPDANVELYINWLTLKYSLIQILYFLINSSQELIHIQSYCAQSIARDATSMRQSAEWGMRAFQSSMPRIKDRMKFEERGERKVTINGDDLAV